MDHVFVIDTNAERRASVCRTLLSGDRHAEPFETIEEFLGFPRSAGLALVHDDDGATARLCAHLSEDPQLVPVIGYDDDPELANAVMAVQAGAASYLSWPFTHRCFSKEIERIGPTLRKGLERQRRMARARSQLAGLTPREREVLASLVTHGTNKAIAKELAISPRTIEKYRAGILTRLGVDNTAQAVRIAVEGGLFDQPGSEGVVEAAQAVIAERELAIG